MSIYQITVKENNREVTQSEIGIERLIKMYNHFKRVNIEVVAIINKISGENKSDLVALYEKIIHLESLLDDYNMLYRHNRRIDEQTKNEKKTQIFDLIADINQNLRDYEGTEKKFLERQLYFVYDFIIYLVCGNNGNF